MQRWKLTIEYEGTNYSGFQIQDNVPTIQGELEKAIYAFCQQNIKITVAGRTDAGVHATGQVAHFDLDYGDRKIDGFSLAKAINAHLINHPIAVLHAQAVDKDFHARFDAHNKEYMYRIISRPSKLAIEQNRVWHIRTKLNAKAMHEAGQILVGKHDFTSFRDTACQAKNPIRTIDRLEIICNEIDNFGGEDIRLYIEGQSFLHHQVRNIIGTLVLVGQGKWNNDDVKNALQAKDRKAAGPTAPPEGLYLVRIDY